MRMLVIQTAFLGDAILTLPLIQAIKSKFPAAQIDVLAIPLTKNVFEHSPFVNNVFVLDKKGKEKSFFKTLAFAFKLRKNKYDKIFSPHRSFRTSLIVKILSASESIGFDNAAWKGVYSKVVHYRQDVHEVARNLSLLDEDFLKEGNWEIQPFVKEDEKVKAKVEEFLSQLPTTKIAAVAPGSVWETKKYPIQYFKEVVKFLLEQGYTVLMIGGQNDFELCESFRELSKEKVINSAGKFSPVETISLLRHCEFVISNDSAPTHMGQAAGIKTLTIYTSTVPQFGFYPYLEGSTYLSYDNLDCKPCGIHGRKECPIKTFDCGFLLKPSVVIEKIKSLTEA